MKRHSSKKMPISKDSLQISRADNHAEKAHKISLTVDWNVEFPEKKKGTFFSNVAQEL